MGADFVIAVDLTRYSRSRELAEPDLRAADIVISPQTVRTRLLDFTAKLQNIAAGEEAATRGRLPNPRADRRSCAHEESARGALAFGRLKSRAAMCQLLGMNCNVPTDICFSFEGFHRRGGSTDHHADGWGIAFFEGPGCRVFLDSKPAVESPIAELVRNYPIRSMNVIAHIRKATTRRRGAREYASVRARAVGPLLDLRAQRHAGGFLAGARRLITGRSATTDSERAFCYMLETLRAALSWRRSRRSSAVLRSALRNHARARAARPLQLPACRTANT